MNKKKIKNLIVKIFLGSNSKSSSGLRGIEEALPGSSRKRLVAGWSAKFWTQKGTASIATASL